MATIEAHPAIIQQGGRVALEAFPTTARANTRVVWEIEGFGAPTATGDTTAVWDVPSGQQPAEYLVTATFVDKSDGRPANDDASERVEVVATPLGPGGDVTVRMQRAAVDTTPDQILWVAIRNTTRELLFDEYKQFIDEVMCGDVPEDAPPGTGRELWRVGRRRALPYPDVDAYRLLKVATEVFMMVKCGVAIDPDHPDLPFQELDLAAESRRLGIDDLSQGDVERRWLDFIEEIRVGATGQVRSGTAFTLPYLAVIRRRLGDQRLVDGEEARFGAVCEGILRDKLTNPCLLELIWSYWHEEGMLVQTLNAISVRFQNRLGARASDPLAHLEIDPLRPLNNLLWGYIQDEQHRLTVLRRAYEYDHHYGITLVGKAVPAIRGADSRSKFLDAFHNLLNLTAIFFKEDDDTTVLADGFPILNALKDVHLLLTEGQHNQYGDLPWMARQEMLMQEWLLARPEMTQFLPTRTMVAYPEAWMGPVDTMKRLQEWTDTPVMHFRDLGLFGERILLSIRFGNWNAIIDRESAANWARYWRPEIQGYLHAYRAVTGIDLTAERVDATMPAVHLQRRLTEQLQGRRQPALADGRLQAQLARPASAQLGAGRRAQLPSDRRAQLPARPLDQ
jgi:hypothetical protein